MKHAAAFLLFWISLWWLWQLLVGEWGRYEWYWAAGAATVGALLAELAVTHASARAALPFEILKSAPAALGMVFVDFAIVMSALTRRRGGVFRTTNFRHPDTVPFRAWATIVGDYSPNAYVVDIAGGRTTTHHLVPRQSSQEPA
ncbi:MAG TPA: hypothetical protein VGK79_06350 [Gaiellaceae bacterium]